MEMKQLFWKFSFSNVWEELKEMRQQQTEGVKAFGKLKDKVKCLSYYNKMCL